MYRKKKERGLDLGDRQTYVTARTSQRHQDSKTCYRCLLDAVVSHRQAFLFGVVEPMRCCLLRVGRRFSYGYDHFWSGWY